MVVSADVGVAARRSDAAFHFATDGCEPVEHHSPGDVGELSVHAGGS